MKTFLKIAALCLSLFFVAPKSPAQISIHLGIGNPYVRPWADAVWTPGYYYYEPEYGRRVWMAGRWNHHDNGRHVGWFKEKGPKFKEEKGHGHWK
jgi:hypothetical protein